MDAALQIAHWCAGLIVLAEALNKMERTTPFARGLAPLARLLDGLKALSWLLFALGAGGAVVTPLLLHFGVHVNPWERINHQIPSLAETAVMCGFAVLIIRTRVKEG